MRFMGVLLLLAGWLIPIAALSLTQSLAVRFILALLGIGISLVAILVVLNKAHLKHAVWRG